MREEKVIDLHSRKILKLRINKKLLFKLLAIGIINIKNSDNNVVIVALNFNQFEIGKY